MSGLSKDTPQPEEIIVHRASQRLEIAFSDGQRFSLPFEYLRVFTPSAEARGHGPGQEVLQVGKRGVTIECLEPVGNYAVRPVFSDGHDSGIYSWEMLYNLGQHHDALWQAYLDKLAAEGKSREPSDQPPPPQKSGCGHHH